MNQDRHEAPPLSARKWTRARVLRAYAEWDALQKHAFDVIARYDRAGDSEEAQRGLWRLGIPGWIGTGWPGSDFEVYTYDDGDDYPIRLPLEYLWTTDWEAKRRAQHEEWRKSREGQDEERRERAEYERLKAKFAPPGAAGGED